jgi:Family of unknown function (DUF6193)
VTSWQVRSLGTRCRVAPGADGAGDERHDWNVVDQPGPARPDPVLYPDVARVGDLPRALQAEFDTAGVAARAQHVPEPSWRYVGAQVSDAERKADVVMGIRERVFCLQFWARGVCMASGTTDDFPAAAAAMHAWQSGTRVRQLVSTWPFLGTDGFAEAYERGDADAIDYRWRQYLDNPHREPHLAQLHPFIAMAFRESRLRALLPLTSHEVLGFSRTVGYPYSGDCPWIAALDDGRYLVETAEGRALGTADAAGSVALAVTALGEEPTR